jgi:hypothetical protein
MIYIPKRRILREIGSTLAAKLRRLSGVVLLAEYSVKDDESGTGNASDTWQEFRIAIFKSAERMCPQIDPISSRDGQGRFIVH